MEGEECIKMLDHLQQYVPHLEKLIAQLKDPTQRNCELQLNKLEALCTVIKDRKKKLKLDTLRKSEDAILRILHKLRPTIFKQLMSKPEPSSSNQMIKFVCKDPPEGCNKISLGETDDFINLQKLTAARARLSEIAITPASPSPPRYIPLVHAPIALPTEKIHKLALNPNEFHSKKWDVKTQPNLSQPYNESYKTEKPNVDTRAAESVTSSSSKKIGRLGTKVYTSKPPLLTKDLLQLTASEGENYFATAAERDSYCADHEQLAIGELKEPLINIPPTNGSFMRPSSGSSNMQDHNTTNNQMIYGNNQMGNVNNQMVQQTELMDNQNKFISTQQNLMHQNIPANRCGNTYMKTFRVQNNVSNNIFHDQFKITLNATPNTFDNKINPAKVFHPSDPIERSSEHYLSKIPITKEKQTDEEITTAEVEVKIKTIAKEKIKVVEKEDIAKEPDTKEKGENKDEEENEGEEQNEKLLKPQKISLRKRKRRGGQTKMKKDKVLQSKQPLKTLKVNIKKKVQSCAKLEDNVIETVGERVKNKRRNIKMPEPTKTPKCRTELDMLHEDIKEIFLCDGETSMNQILKSDSEEAAETDIISTRSFRNRLTSTADEDAASVFDSPKRQAPLCNLKVAIAKTDLSKLVASKSKKDSDSENESLEATRLRVKTRPMSRRKICLDTKGTTSDSNSLSPIKRFMPKRNLKPKPSYKEDTDEELPRSMSEPEEEPLKQEDPQANSNQKEAVAKKGQNWASSVIKKSYKKKLHSYTTSPKALVYIEPDKNYYFDPHDKSECKLCSFKGNMIVQHYKTKHAKHEVLISRISPDNANTAIEESIDNDYEDIEVTDTWEVKNGMKKFSYQCRFCQMFFKNETSESFFDHLTGHTGEYRFICKLCPFKTTNCKCLRFHMHSSHNASVKLLDSIMPTYQAPPNFHIAFGYICAKCNFIQMDKTSVETHVKIYHLGENMKIYKINMSTIVTKPTEVPVENASAEVREEVSKKPNESEVEQRNEIEKVEKPVPQVQELQPEPVKKTVKEDPAVFKPNTEYAQENIELDKQKHEKMKEINKYILPRKKFTFNLLDKIKSRLDDRHVEAVTKEIENNGISIQLNSSADSITSCSKKSVVQESMENNLEKSTVNKTSVPISNIIDHLQGKLNVDAAQSASLIPLNEFKIKFVPDREEAIVRVGPVGAIKKNDYISYICYMQYCMFSSRRQSEFAIHCKNFHGNKLWDGFCSICNINTSFTKVEEAYDHLLSMHKNDFAADKQTITIESSENQCKVKYVCMQSGDKLSENWLDGSNILDDDESLCRIVNVESQQEEVLESSHGFPFHIANITTLTPEEEQAFNTPEITPPTTAVEKVMPTSTVINTMAGARDITTASSPTTSPIAIPFPLQSTSGSSNGLLVPLMPPVWKCVEVIQHSKRAHPGMEASVIATPSTPTIKPIVSKRKYPSNMWESSSSNDEVQAKQPALETGENPAEAEADLDDTSILICNYCSKCCDTESDLLVHWEAMHKLTQPQFKYRKVIRSQCFKKGGIKYKCCFCDTIGPMEMIKRHFRTEHPGITFAVFRYQCPHCGDHFKIINKLKDHCRIVHNDSDPVGFYIEEPDETSIKPNDYVCEYCGMEFEVRQEIIDHYKSVHLYLEVNLPPDLTMQLAPQSEEEDEMKKYMCPKCSYKSNSNRAIRKHIQRHVKASQCYYCPYRNTYPYLIKQHQIKEHPNLELKCKSVEEAKEMSKILMENLLVLEEDGSYRKIRFKNANQATSDQPAQPSKVRIVDHFEFENKPHAGKLTARKSTTQVGSQSNC